jgi:hypothetical protein
MLSGVPRLRAARDFTAMAKIPNRQIAEGRWSKPLLALTPSPPPPNYSCSKS